MRSIHHILEEIEILQSQGLPQELPLQSLCFDSRKVKPGDCFVAVRGTVTDGHRYMEQAVAQGAILVVCEELPENPATEAAWVQVADSARALGLMASAWYEHPSRQLMLCGITGTNGKTTIASLLYQLFRELGYKAGLFSTVNTRVNDTVYGSSHTTPDPVLLNARMQEMVEAGCEYAFMEVSSHALHQQRVSGLHFAGGLFTNLTHDHLDYHKTFAEYLKAKKLFFDQLSPEAFALVNSDDKNGSVMLQNTRAAQHSYALKRMADFRGSILEHSLEGMALKIDGEEVWTRFVGRYNAYNLLAVYAAALLLGEEKQEVLTALSKSAPVDGRLETLRSADGKLGIVDYAHTPDALKNVLENLLELRKVNQRIITVVGTGGDRDAQKRPVMAQVAVSLSDQVVLTSDNPRTENPEAILDDMMKGVKKADEERVLRITDRRQAIKTACLLADKGDIILVAGKGHETYQEVMGERVHFDDREEIRKHLEIKN